MERLTLERLHPPSSLLPLPEDADAEFVQAAAEDGGDFYSICAGGQAVGAALTAGEGCAFLYVYIFPEHRRRGNGSIAAQALERLLFGAGARTVRTCWRSRDTVRFPCTA